MQSDGSQVLTGWRLLDRDAMMDYHIHILLKRKIFKGVDGKSPFRDGTQAFLPGSRHVNQVKSGFGRL